MTLLRVVTGSGRPHGGVFISYRTADSVGYGALLYLELSRRLGESMVFLDCESIPAGSDCAGHLFGRLRRCEVLLAVVGPGWLGRDATGRRHIDLQDDWVRRELAEAYAAGLRVIPVLTDGAVMPSAAELPSDIAAFGRCQYRRLRRADIRADLGRLVADLADLVEGYSALDPAICPRCRLAGQPGPLGRASGRGIRIRQRFRLPGAVRAEPSAATGSAGGTVSTKRHRTAR